MAYYRYNMEKERMEEMPDPAETQKVKPPGIIDRALDSVDWEDVEYMRNWCAENKL